MVIKPWLWLPAKVSHDLSPVFLSALACLRAPQKFTWQPLQWRHLAFANPLGISGGVDKNAESLNGWWALGTGFIEVGTITPLAQKGHTGKIIARSTKKKALWNRMGFPNKGASTVSKNLSHYSRPYHTPVFVNIGKNKTTPNESAYKDYISGMKSFAAAADAYVINVSSPNTAGLRELLQEQNFKRFLHPLINAKAEIESLQNREIPLIIKISPDISDDELKQILDSSLALGVDGWILTNTSSSFRSGLSFPAEGGISGAPLKSTALKMLRLAKSHLGQSQGDRLLISSGGVLSPEDVFERLNAGANLVQVYAALVFSGPMFFKEVADYACSHT